MVNSVVSIKHARCNRRNCNSLLGCGASVTLWAGHGLRGLWILRWITDLAEGRKEDDMTHKRQHYWDGRTFEMIVVFLAWLALIVWLNVAKGAEIVKVPVIALVVDPYTAAFERARVEGKPVVVFVSATWCGPCQNMHSQVIPAAKQDAAFQGVVYVEIDASHPMAERLSIPRMTMFRWNGTAWIGERPMIGFQPLARVVRFLRGTP